MLVTQHCFSHNCLDGWPRVVSAPIQRFIALSVQLWGDYLVHRGALYLRAASGLLPVEVADSCFLWLWPFFFFGTLERLSQGRRCRGPAEGCEGSCLFSYHSRHSTHILFLLRGPVTPTQSLRQVHNRTLFRSCSTSAEYLKIAQHAVL